MTAATLEDTLSEESEDSLYPMIGRLLGLNAVHTEVDLVDRVETGLTIRAVHNLQANAELSDAETYELIAPRRTLHRREAPGQTLSSEEGDKAVRIARVFARARQAFAGRPHYAGIWLREPKTALGDRTPFQLLATESGAIAVEEQLIAIEHGMFA